jgi:hypothetical protein
VLCNPSVFELLLSLIFLLCLTIIFIQNINSIIQNYKLYFKKLVINQIKTKYDNFKILLNKTNDQT